MSAQSQMTSKERVRATLAGQDTDRSPISFWHHFPGRDRAGEEFIEATLDFQRRYELDVVKLMPTGMYCVLDYGATIALREDEIGTTRVLSTPVSRVSDWARLSPAALLEGELRNQVEIVRCLRAALGPDTPILPTIFSPLTIAQKLAGATLAQHLQQDESAVQQALELFATDVVSFGEACLDAGADGFFFATQHASPGAGLSRPVFDRLGTAYDIRVLNALAEDERNWCTVLHLHGLDPYFELADRYPVHAVNWHDRETYPSIRQALGATQRALFAGIARRGAATTTDIQGAMDEVRDAIQQSSGHRLVVAPGCVIPYTAPIDTLRAARRAVDQRA